MMTAIINEAATSKLLGRAKARRIAANIAKLPELVRKPQSGD
jgi:hypothetical protein